MRVIVRRERPHPGAQLSLFEERDGWRYQAFVTNTRIGQLAFLEARHRAHARVEDRIRHAKDTGLGRFPSREFAINQTWLTDHHRRRPDRLDPATGPERRRERPRRVRAQGAALPPSPRPGPTHPQWTAASSANPAVLALGGRDRRGLREHRRDPTTRLTRPVHPPHHHRRTAARQRQPALPHTRRRPRTQLTHRRDPHEHHERPGLGPPKSPVIAGAGQEPAQESARATGPANRLSSTVPRVPR